MSPIHRCVDGHAGNFHDCASDDLSIRWATTAGPTPLSRSDPVLRFVRLRQRFLLRCLISLAPEVSTGRTVLATSAIWICSRGSVVDASG
jgi:hypothetical protein